MEKQINFHSNICAIIVTYNGAYWIEKCLQSLENSSTKVDIIVVDNCSNDNTVELIIDRFPHVLLIQSEVNLGFGKANNLGILKALDAGADYFFLLNQDAWVLPNTIEELIRVQRSNPEYFILSPVHLDGSGVNLDFSFSTYVSPYNCQGFISDVVLRNNNMKDVYPINFVNAALWLVSKESVNVVGYFDPIFPHYGEDDDYLQRVLYHSGKIGICPSAFGFHDRDQSPVDVRKFSLERRYKRQIVACLITLMNINKSFYHCFMVFMSTRMNFFFVELFRLRFKVAFIEFKVLIYVLFKIPEIKRRRLANMKVANSQTAASLYAQR
jgi:GT2 family glycosyltransferase